MSQITSSINKLVKSNKRTTRQISRLKTFTDYSFDDSTLFSGEDDDDDKEDEKRGKSNCRQLSAIRKNQVVHAKHGIRGGGKSSNGSKKCKGGNP